MIVLEAEPESEQDWNSFWCRLPAEYEKIFLAFSLRPFFKRGISKLISESLVDPVCDHSV